METVKPWINYLRLLSPNYTRFGFLRKTGDGMVGSIILGTRKDVSDDKILGGEDDVPF